jgi:predicted HicB family RNase H-like nuclease
MKRKPKRKISDKIIHIRVDEIIHHKLKMKAASSKTTIQEIVEGMLKRKFSS